MYHILGFDYCDTIGIMMQVFDMVEGDWVENICIFKGEYGWPND